MRRLRKAARTHHLASDSSIIAASSLVITVRVDEAVIPVRGSVSRIWPPGAAREHEWGAPGIYPKHGCIPD